jgi:hypothetical protein
MRRIFRLPPVAAGFLAAACALLAGCDDGGGATEPVAVEEGLWITDSSYTLDPFPFGAEACAEVFPAGSANTETRAEDAAAWLRTVSTACYRVRVRVMDSAKDTVRVFESRFGIFNRTDEEKNRGVVGYVSWDGKDGQGRVLPGGVYLWRMEFDFGAGRVRKFRFEVLLP